MVLLLAMLLACVCPCAAQQQQQQQPDASQSGVAVSAARGVRSYLFVSPNTRENLTLDEALRMLDSPEEIRLMKDGRAIACQLELRARIVKTIGSWTDGVEHSTLSRIEADEETARYAVAWLGKRARQKSVLYFQQRSGGTGRMYALSARGGGRHLALIAKRLDRSGIAYRTLAPMARRTLVYVVDFKDELRKQIAVAARRLGARYRVLRGTGDFIGDDNDRDKAQEVFSQVISAYEQKHPPQNNNCAVRPSQFRLLKKNSYISVKSSYPHGLTPQPHH